MYKPTKSLVLLTGGAGFIGCNVARRLANLGFRVIVSDTLGSEGKWQNLIGVPLTDFITPFTTVDWLNNYASEVCTVIHLGAVSATTETDADLILKSNIRLSFDLWKTCSERNIRFIYASSAATYGDGSLGFEDTEDLSRLRSLRPLNAYGWSKWLVDCRFVDDVVSGGMHPPQWAGLRFFNVYGPYEDHKGDMRSVVNKIYPLVRAEKAVTLFKSYNPRFKDGEQLRDFIYVDDCVEVICWLLTNPHVSGIFNVGSGVASTFYDLAKFVFSAVGTKLKIEYVEMPESIRARYQYYTQADLKKLREAGFQLPFTSLEEGIKLYVDRYLKNHFSR